MNSLTISLVSEHASPLAVLGGVDAGGQNVHVAALASALADLGHRVTVHTRRDDPGLPDYVPLRAGVTVHHVTAGPPGPLPKDELLPFMEEFGSRLAGRWADRPPDVVHSHFWMSGVAALLGAGGLGVPVVHTYHALGTVKRRHQGSLDTSPAQRIEVETEVGADADRIVATCRDEVSELAAMGLPTGHVRVIPCGVDTARFTPHGAAVARPLRPRLLVVGRLVPRKGIDTAIAVLARMPRAELVVLGGPPSRELATDQEARRLRELAERAGVADRFVMLGGVPSDWMPRLLRSADVVLCPARYEPFGIVPLEAMACGVPVVATAVGGHLDSVADGVTGRLVPPDDPTAMAVAAAELIVDRTQRTAYGLAGRRRAVDRFGWSRVAAATAEVYGELADPVPVPAGAGRSGGVR
jgi:D-inositol-3-phosphate glycosyltransferase